MASPETSLAATSKEGGSSDQSIVLIRELSHLHYSPDFEVKERLGRGGFGSVFKCIGLLDRMTYAVKQVHFSEKDYEKVVREIRVLSSMSHPNVVRYHQAWIVDSVQDVGSVFGSSTETDVGAASRSTTETDIGAASRSTTAADIGAASRSTTGIDVGVACGSATENELKRPNMTLYIVMEYCPRTLENLIREGLDITQARQFFKQLVGALVYLHQKGVVHRDISRQNLFVDSSGNIKLGDFGLATYAEEERIQCSISGGNPQYQAPEMTKNPPLITPKADIFASGLVLLEMVYPMPSEAERVTVFHQAKNGVLPEDAPEEFVHLIELLLRRQLNTRPSAVDILGYLD